MALSFPRPLASGLALQDGDEINRAVARGDRYANGTIAATGSTVADATALQLGINNVSSDSSAKGWVLPKAFPGRNLIINNSTATAGVLYGQGSDTIDAASSKNLGASVAAILFCVTGGAWLARALGASL